MGDAVRLEEDDVGGGLHVAQEEALLDLVHLGHPAAAGTPANLPPVQGPCIEKRNIKQPLPHLTSMLGICRYTYAYVLVKSIETDVGLGNF